MFRATSASFQRADHRVSGHTDNPEHWPQSESSGHEEHQRTALRREVSRLGSPQRRVLDFDLDVFFCVGQELVEIAVALEVGLRSEKFERCFHRFFVAAMSIFGRSMSRIATFLAVALKPFSHLSRKSAFRTRMQMDREYSQGPEQLASPCPDATLTKFPHTAGRKLLARRLDQSASV